MGSGKISPLGADCKSHQAHLGVEEKLKPYYE
jgi:hypothetical protein